MITRKLMQIIREILNNGNVEDAIKNGYELENKYKVQGKTITLNIKEMNPYTNIHGTIEQFMAEISLKFNSKNKLNTYTQESAGIQFIFLLSKYRNFLKTIVHRSL